MGLPPATMNQAYNGQTMSIVAERWPAAPLRKTPRHIRRARPPRNKTRFLDAACSRDQPNLTLGK